VDAHARRVAVKCRACTSVGVLKESFHVLQMKGTWTLLNVIRSVIACEHALHAVERALELAMASVFS